MAKTLKTNWNLLFCAIGKNGRGVFNFSDFFNDLPIFFAYKMNQNSSDICNITLTSGIDLSADDTLLIDDAPARTSDCCDLLMTLILKKVWTYKQIKAKTLPKTAVLTDCEYNWPCEMM